MTDENPHNPGTRFLRFWVDKAPSSPENSQSHGDGGHTNPLASARDVNRAPMTPDRRERVSLVQEALDRNRSQGSPDFYEDDGHCRGHIPEGDRDSVHHREHIPENSRPSPPRPSNQPGTPPEDQVPRGCSLHSMEPLQEWFCRGADMTSSAEYEAALCQLEDDPPDIRQCNVNIREERWSNFSLEGVRFPAMTVDVIQRGEALAVFERDLIIHFQQISRATALYIRALLGGIKRTDHRREMAYTCGRCLDGIVDNFEPSHRSVEKHSVVKSSS